MQVPVPLLSQNLTKPLSQHIPTPKPAPSTTLPISAVGYTCLPITQTKNLCSSLTPFFLSHPFPIFQKILLALPSKSTNNQDTSQHPPLPPCSKPPSPLPRVSAIGSFSLLPSLSPASILRTAGRLDCSRVHSG